MKLVDLPEQATWRHQGARDGFEVLFSTGTTAGHVLSGHTTAVEAGEGWSVGYVVDTDDRWRTTKVRVTTLSRTTESTVTLRRRDEDGWFVDGEPRPDLDGCVDVDLESSSVTNTLPLHRIDLPIGETLSVPAAFVTARDLRVERLEQKYTRLDDAGRFAYTSSTFDFSCELRYDASGLIVRPSRDRKTRLLEDSEIDPTSCCAGQGRRRAWGDRRRTAWLIQWAGCGYDPTRPEERA